MRQALSGAELEPSSEAVVLSSAVPLWRLRELESAMLFKYRAVGYDFEAQWMRDQLKAPARFATQIENIVKSTRIKVAEWTNARNDALKLAKDIDTMRHIRALKVHAESREQGTRNWNDVDDGKHDASRAAKRVHHERPAPLPAFYEQPAPPVFAPHAASQHDVEMKLQQLANEIQVLVDINKEFNVILMVDRNTSIAEFEMKLHGKLAIERQLMLNDFTLAYQGKPLMGGKTLHDYGVADNTTIHASGKLIGRFVFFFLAT